MGDIAVKYFPSLFNTGNNEEKSKFHSYINDDNYQDVFDSHATMFHLFKKFLEPGILVSGMSTVWEDTDDCDKQYSCALDIYLITVLSSSCGIIMDRSINAPCHGIFLLME